MSALRKVINAVEDSDLLTPLRHISQATRPEDASDFVQPLLICYGKFRGSARAFGVQEKRVCRIMKLGSLLDDPLWRSVLNARALAPAQLVRLHELRARVHFAINYAPSLVALTAECEASCKRIPEGKSVLALGVRPLDATLGVDSAQLAHALHGLEMIYVACCAVCAIDAGQITVHSWRSQPLPMFSVLVDKPVRGAIDNALASLTEVVAEHQGQRSRTSLTDALIDSTLFRQLDAVSEAGVLDERAGDETAELLLDGCLELLSASVIPPGLSPASQVKLDTVTVIAEYEMREHLQSVESGNDSAPVEPSDTHDNVVSLMGNDGDRPETPDQTLNH